MTEGQKNISTVEIIKRPVFGLQCLFTLYLEAGTEVIQLLEQIHK